MLQLGASHRIAELARGVILAMIIDKLKWTLVTLTLALGIVIGSGVTVRAFGFQRESQQKDPVPRSQEKGNAARQGLESDMANEELADQLEEHRIDAELLEIENETLTQAMRRNLEAIRRLETGSGGTRSGQSDDLKKMVDELIIRGEEMKQDFVKKRRTLAQLKRQIARESKALRSPESKNPDLAEIGRRLRALEEKVDQIAESLSRPAR
jgi:hypothetical protein